MKKLIGILLAAAIMTSAVNNAYAWVRVRGYTRSNGTYVAPHFRTSPDGYTFNNLSNW